MVGAVALGITVAVLAKSQVCLVDLPGGALACSPLPGPGLTVLATPDRKVLVPLRTEDATLRLDPGGRIERWRGRFVPLFFDEADRAYVVFPGELATVSYPDRVVLTRIPLNESAGATCATVSRDGRLVAVSPTGAVPPAVVLVAARERRSLGRVALPAAAVHMAGVADSDVTVVALADRTVRVVMPELGVLPGGLELPAAATALTVRPDGKVVIVGVSDGPRGLLVRARLGSGARHPLKETSRAEVGGAVRAAAFAGNDLVTLVDERVALRSGRGDKVKGEVVVEGAVAIAVLPQDVGFAVPVWDEE